MIVTRDGERVKLAVIRSDSGGGGGCPFGLPIPLGCKYAGPLVKDMMPKNGENNDDSAGDGAVNICKYNYNLFVKKALYSAKKHGPCVFSEGVMDFNSNVTVSCNYGDSAQGIGEAPFTPTNHYVKDMGDGSISGLYAYPSGLYTDYVMNRNLYYGIATIQG